jgi:signal transduction histidine kinase
LTIFLRDPTNRTNRTYGFFSLAAVSWTLSNYLSEVKATNIWLLRLTFLSGVLIFYTVTQFIISMKSAQSIRFEKLITIFKFSSYLVAILSLTPFFVVSESPGNAGSSINTGFGYVIFLVYLALAFVYGVIMMLYERQHASSPIVKKQLSIISLSVIIYAILAIGANVVLPLLVNNWSSSNYGPIFTLVFVGVLAYAIIRHRLFDIRLVIIRSLGYVLSFGVIGAILFFALLNLGYLTSKHGVPIKIDSIYFALLSLLFAILFNPAKQVFDKLTMRLFYRDAYRTQDVLNDFNKLLVSTIRAKEIMNATIKTLKQHIKVTNVSFIVYDTDDTHRTFGDMKEVFDEQFLKSISNELKGNHKKLLFVDDIEGINEDLRLLCLKYNISAFAQLIDSSLKKPIGVLLLGYKKSGERYLPQDQQLINILVDELSIALQNALRFEEIELFNVTLQAKVDEATRELKITNKKLKALDETKDDFISMASHQLRTPLSIIKGYVNMVVHGDAGKINTQQKEFLEQAQISSETMVRLVTELLNVSRITSGKFSVDSNPVNLADIVENETQQLTNMAKERNIELTFNKPKDFPVLMLDEEKIRQVVANFIDNAIHYSKDKGAKINVQLTNKDDIIFEVIDNGIGVPPNEKEHLFTKFYRAKNAKEARPNGTGVGIYLAKVVINELGGDLIFESKEGIGSTFGFRFKKDKIVEPSGKS